MNLNSYYRGKSYINYLRQDYPSKIAFLGNTAILIVHSIQCQDSYTMSI